MSNRRKNKSQSKNAFVKTFEDNNDQDYKMTRQAIIKSLPTIEYIQATVQKDVQQGLLRVARLKPSNPIEFLGKYLLEKSKNNKQINNFFFYSFYFYYNYFMKLYNYKNGVKIIIFFDLLFFVEMKK